MLILVKSPMSNRDLEKAAQDFKGYVKFVVDLEREVLTAGGARHFEGEELLLQDGSKQENLWGGGLDLETNDLDYDSMINIRPKQGNTSREVLSEEIRRKIEEVVRKLIR